jgi:hypothetical protein
VPKLSITTGEILSHAHGNFEQKIWRLASSSSSLLIIILCIIIVKIIARRENKIVDSYIYSKVGPGKNGRAVLAKCQENGRLVSEFRLVYLSFIESVLAEDDLWVLAYKIQYN